MSFVGGRGKDNPMYGKKRPDLIEYNRTHPTKKGKDNPNWKGGRNEKCIDCGEPISFYAKRCRKCAYIGINNPRIGTHHTTEWRKNHSGKNHHNWKGGVTPLRQKIYDLPEYKQWRYEVFVRDNFTCVECHKIGGKLNAHHIKGKELILKENHITTVWEAQFCKELWDVENGVTFCEDCHNLTKGGRKREG